jgi:hypothetical protein
MVNNAEEVPLTCESITTEHRATAQTIEPSELIQDELFVVV